MAALEEICRRLEDHVGRGDVMAFLDDDREFHLIAARAAGNSRLASAIESLRDQFLRVGIYALQRSGRMAEATAEHLKILEGLKARDIQAVRAAVTEHLRATYKEVLGAL
ncbi:MAG TPA: hypothetical protein DHW14_08145 [Clostridiales bacterium]|nr:hypothetical protein [Clostridiales bacterium]